MMKLVTKEELHEHPDFMREVILGYDDAGMTHVPDEVGVRFTEAMCASVFSNGPIAVRVEHVPVDTLLTCLRCLVSFEPKLAVVVKGTMIRVT